MQKLKILFVGLTVIANLLLLPLLVQNDNFISYADTSSPVGTCSLLMGSSPPVAPSCKDMNTNSCPGGWVDNYCTGPANIKCCIPTTGNACYSTFSGACQKVGGTQPCNGTYNAGSYCPGPSNVQCCVPATPPSPTNVNFSCVPSSSTSDTATVTWSVPSGYTYSYARIHDETTNTQLYSGVITGNSYSRSDVIPGHSYSWWVHTTYASGTPFSAAVPTAHTATLTCPMPTCGDNTTPSGSTLSTGTQTSASNILSNNAAAYGPQNAVDGVMDLNKYWNSGTSTTPQWIEINLGAQQLVSGFKLYVRQNPNGATTTEIKTGLAPNPQTISRTLNCYTSDNQVINVVLASPSAAQYVRVNTTATTSWIAWNELSVFGSAPGVQTDTPGIVYSGDVPAEFGKVGGRASINDWVVGGQPYSEVFPTKTNPSITSYNYLHDKIVHAGIHITEMGTPSLCPTLSNCTLPSGLANGVYHANGNVTLNGFAFTADKNVIFMIDGDLTIKGSIIVPSGATAIFTSSHDIIIDRSVGTAINLFPLPSGQIQGIFSADHDFTMDGINKCTTGKDKMLNIEGNIITNASGAGGHFRNLRDLCGDNPTIPSFTVRLRLDFILNSPSVLSRQNITLREENP